MKHKRDKRINLLTTQPIYEALKMAAADKGVSTNELLNTVIDNYLKYNGYKQREAYGKRPDRTD